MNVLKFRPKPKDPDKYKYQLLKVDRSTGMRSVMSMADLMCDLVSEVNCMESEPELYFPWQRIDPVSQIIFIITENELC